MQGSLEDRASDALDTSARAAGTAVIQTVRRALLASASAIAACFIVAAHPVSAADVAASDDSGTTQQLQEVIVTGSLIARPAAETAESVQVVTAQDLTNQGVVNVEQALSLISANVPSQINIASSIGTFSGGGTYANLRGIGEGRTLILMDGQRLANNAFSGNAVDLTGIPFSAIESIQVLREGASALYGSDAIAGVINFITKKDFQGLEIQANAERPQRSGGSSDYVNLTAGHGDLVNDGYNAMVTASYSKQNELKATQRAFSAAGFYPGNGVAQTNDPGTWPGTVIDANGAYWQPGYPGCAGNPYLTTYFGNCAYRYSAATDLLPDATQLSIMATLTKSLPGNNTLSLQYLVARSEVTAWSGPMFYFFQMTPATNPTYYPTAAQLTTCWQGCTPGAGPALGGPIDAVWSDPANNRYSGYINDEQRWLLTFAGNNGGWDYKLNLNFSQNNNDNRNVSGYPNEAILSPGGNLSDLINPFGPQTAAGQSLINSSYINGVYANGRMKRWSFDGNANHELGDLFNAGTNATFALGFSLEGDNFSYATTPYNTLVQAATGYTNQSIEGARTLQAVFFELDVPMAKGLDLDVSDRQDRYSDFGLTNNGKLALRYQPFEILTFRGTASTGFRAPTLYDLYKPNNLSASTSGNMGLGNPFCVPPYSNPEWSQATCSTQGLGLFGGNKTLSPETSQNFDLGFVVQPIADMGVTVDYYRINLKNTIANIPPTAIYANPTGLASQIVTNSSGTLTPSIEEAADCTPYTATTCGYILQNYQNTGSVTTAGFDLSIQYQQRTPIGKFHEDVEGTTVTKFNWQEYTGGPTVNLVGSSEGGTVYQPALRWTHTIRVDWTSPESMFGAGLSNRYLSSYQDEFNTGPTQSGPTRTVGAYSTFNTYVSYRPIKSLTAMFGIQNLFDTNPPFTNASQGNFAAGYNSTLTNPLLRTFYLNLKYTIH